MDLHTICAVFYREPSCVLHHDYMDLFWLLLPGLGSLFLILEKRAINIFQALLKQTRLLAPPVKLNQANATRNCLAQTKQDQLTFQQSEMGLNILGLEVPFHPMYFPFNPARHIPNDPNFFKIYQNLVASKKFKSSRTLKVLQRRTFWSDR